MFLVLGHHGSQHSSAYHFCSIIVLSWRLRLRENLTVMDIKSVDSTASQKLEIPLLTTTEHGSLHFHQQGTQIILETEEVAGNGYKNKI